MTTSSDLFANLISDPIRVLFAGDGHAHHKTPTSRKDDYLEASIAELNESLEVARDNECDAWIHLGDFFHDIDPSGECRNRVLRTLQADRDGRAWPMRKIGLIGNHDIKSSPDNLPFSAIETLFSAGVVEKSVYDDSLGIAFAHFRGSLTEEIADGLFCAQPRAVIWAAHASIRTAPHFEKHILFVDTPTGESVRLVVAGHVHEPMEETRIDGIRFINPGSMCRGSLTKQARERQPQLLMVQYNRDGSDLKRKYVPLASALPAEAIFKLDEIDAKKVAKTVRETYIKQINSPLNPSEEDEAMGLGSREPVTREESLRRAARRRLIPQASLDMALWGLGEVKKSTTSEAGDTD